MKKVTTKFWGRVGEEPWIELRAKAKKSALVECSRKFYMRADGSVIQVAIGDPVIDEMKVLSTRTVGTRFWVRQTGYFD